MIHHLPKQYKVSRKEINIDDPYDGSKLFTTIPRTCRIILGSTHPDRHDVIYFLVDRQLFTGSGLESTKSKTCGT